MSVPMIAERERASERAKKGGGGGSSELRPYYVVVFVVWHGYNEA